MAKETMVAREGAVNSLNVNNINYRVGSMVMNVIQRNDIPTQQKNRYLRMIRRAGRNILGLD